MAFLPVQKAFDASSFSSAYIFSCPLRSFPVIFPYVFLVRLAKDLRVKDPPLLLEIQDPAFFDIIRYTDEDSSPENQLFERGITISRIAEVTGIHPLELSFYFSGIAGMDEVTMKVILEQTGNSDIPIRQPGWTTGEPVAVLA